MPIEIRPFSEDTENVPEVSDSRSSNFMDGLRARTAAADEKQQKKWDKAKKPAPVRKPLLPARPEWLNDPTPQAAQKSTNTTRFHTSGPKRKRSVPPRNNDL